MKQREEKGTSIDQCDFKPWNKKQIHPQCLQPDARFGVAGISLKPHHHHLTAHKNNCEIRGNKLAYLLIQISPVALIYTQKENRRSTTKEGPTTGTLGSRSSKTTSGDDYGATRAPIHPH